MFWIDLEGKRDGLGSLWWIINGFKFFESLCPLPLNVGSPFDCLDQENRVKVTLASFQVQA